MRYLASYGSLLSVLVSLSTVAAYESNRASPVPVFGHEQAEESTHPCVYRSADQFYGGQRAAPSAPPAMAAHCVAMNRNDILVRAQQLMFARMRQINTDNDTRMLWSSDRLKSAHVEKQHRVLSRKKRAVLCSSLIPLVGLGLLAATLAKAPDLYAYRAGWHYETIDPSKTLHGRLAPVFSLLVAGACIRALFSCLKQYWAFSQEQERAEDILPRPLSPLEGWSLEQQRDTLQFLLEHPVGRTIVDIPSLAQHYAQRGEGAESDWSTVVRDCSLDRLLGFESADMVRALLRVNAERAQSPSYVRRETE